MAGMNLNIHEVEKITKSVTEHKGSDNPFYVLSISIVDDNNHRYELKLYSHDKSKLKIENK